MLRVLDFIYVTKQWLCDMPRDEQEFLTCLAKHFRVVDAVCEQLKGFESDSELHAFLDANLDESQSVIHHSKRLKDVGVLIEGATGWTAPPFLATFLRQLHERHLLASPKIVQGWIEELQNYSQRLAESINQSANAVSSVNEESLFDLAENIQYTIVKIVDIVRDLSLIHI